MLSRIAGAVYTSVSMLCVLLYISCSGDTVCYEPIDGNRLGIRHASLLEIVECDGYTVADIKNPWRDGILHRYVIVDKDASLPTHLPNGTLLRTPLDSILLFSTVHSELVCMLGHADAVAGVCEAQYMTQPSIRERLDGGSVVDCGSALDINLERVVQLSPHAAWVLPYENGGYGKLDKTSVPLVECVEYMETSPLGAAEWMRFYGRLLGCAHKADSLFAVVEDNYMQLRDTVAAYAGYRPKLMCELKSSSAWYVPAGGSTMGILYKDAGADYLFAGYGGSGSVPLAYETVLDRAADADLWLVKYGGPQKNYASLLDDFGGYVHFAPFRNKKIYACNLSNRRFYEETPFRPDILLREFISILHPHLVENPTLRYYEKMSE